MNKTSPAKNWIYISLLNLSIVALLGVIMRYKIAFALPFVDQKHLLHAHSHFAFSGWISQSLMVMTLTVLSSNLGPEIWKKFNLLLYANMFSAYGMLISFAIQGYGAYSISFSTATIIIAFVYAIRFWKITKHVKKDIIPIAFFKAANIFNLISSAGTFFLAYFMIAHIAHQSWYLAAVYFYLHFQYNGWFLFTCLGLFFYAVENFGVNIKNKKTIFLIFVTTAIPSYFLSCLWMNIPTWVYVLVVLSALGQLIAWIMMLRSIMPQWRSISLQCHSMARYLNVLIAIAFSIKLILQGISTIPSLSSYAFGFRPVVIGYLHLVLLGVISLYLINHFITAGLLPENKGVFRGIHIFIAGILLNELLLMGQGLSFMNYLLFPYSNELLLFAAGVLWLGATKIFIAYRSTLQKKSSPNFD